MPSSRCTRRSARRRTSARSDGGTPTSSEITSIGSRPAKSPMKSNVPASSAGSRWATASSRIRVLHGGHPARREALADDGAHAGVPRRVHGEERHGPVRVGPEGGRVEAHAEGVGVVVDVAERGQDVGVARVGEEVELLVVEDRRLGAQARVGRVRVLVDGVVVGAVGQRRDGGHRPVARHERGRVGHQRRHGVEGQVAHAGAEQRPGVGHLQHAQDGRPPRRRPARPPGGARFRRPCAPARASRRDRRPAARSCRPPRPAGPMDAEAHGAGGVGHPLGQGQAEVDEMRRRLHAAPQHLGQQVVLAREVGVGGRRRHAGPLGDACAPRCPRRAAPRPPAAAAVTSRSMTSAWRSDRWRRPGCSRELGGRRRGGVEHAHARAGAGPGRAPARPLRSVMGSDYSPDTCPDPVVPGSPGSDDRGGSAEVAQSERRAGPGPRAGVIGLGDIGRRPGVLPRGAPACPRRGVRRPGRGHRAVPGGGPRGGDTVGARRPERRRPRVGVQRRAGPARCSQGPDGVFAGAAPGTTVVIVSTIPTDDGARPARPRDRARGSRWSTAA